MRKPAVFLDRDGVLNELVYDAVRDALSSPLSPEQISLFRDASAFVRGVNERGYLMIVTTDQPAMAQGRLSPIKLHGIHAALTEALRGAGARLDAILHCPHDADAHAMGGPVVEEYATPCRCRKPAPGLILGAARDHQVDLQRSFMVCRDLMDVKAGRSASLETILLTEATMREIEAPPALRPHHVAAGLLPALRIIDAAREAAFHS